MLLKFLRYAVGTNFLLFMAEYFWLGGDAFGGYSHAGRYCLEDHGRLTEVSHDIFLFGYYFHALSVAITIPAVTLASFIEYKLNGGSIRDLRR